MLTTCIALPTQIVYSEAQQPTSIAPRHDVQPDTSVFIKAVACFRAGEASRSEIPAALAFREHGAATPGFESLLRAFGVGLSNSQPRSKRRPCVIAVAAATAAFDAPPRSCRRSATERIHVCSERGCTR